MYTFIYDAVFLNIIDKNVKNRKSLTIKRTKKITMSMRKDNQLTPKQR